jgi:pimeloyl-ACP methyl ester carboxylesterase
LAALALILALLTAAPAFAQTNDVAIKARDGFVLKAIYKQPAAGQPTLVMLHGWKSVKEEWAPLMKELDKAGGWGYLAYDSRQEGPRSQFVDDVGMVLQFLEKNGADRKKVALAGASLGANVVLAYAALTNFAGPVVALSPGLDYQGLKTAPMVPRLRKPFLLVASAADSYAYSSVQSLGELNTNAVVWADVKPGHGVQMFDDKFLPRLVSWLNKN